MADGDTVARLANELDKIMRAGLPISSESVYPELLKLVGFTGDPGTTPRETMLPFIVQADDLVRTHLEKLGDNELARATRILFGYAAGCRGLRVGIREQRASQLCDRTQVTIHRWRKKVCLELAWELYRDSLPPTLT